MRWLLTIRASPQVEPAGIGLDAKVELAQLAIGPSELCAMCTSFEPQFAEGCRTALDSIDRHVRSRIHIDLQRQPLVRGRSRNIG